MKNFNQYIRSIEANKTMNLEDKLNDYQKERLSLIFETELMLSGKVLDRIKFNKNFLNEIDIFVTELFQKGVMFYGFTISMPFLEKNDPDFWCQKFCMEK